MKIPNELLEYNINRAINYRIEILHNMPKEAKTPYFEYISHSLYINYHLKSHKEFPTESNPDWDDQPPFLPGAEVEKSDQKLWAEALKSETEYWEKEFQYLLKEINE